jgi:predicted phosphodiesterase
MNPMSCPAWDLEPEIMFCLASCAIGLVLPGFSNFLENSSTMRYPNFMNITPEKPIGLIADSHGNNDLLLRSIRALRDAGAHTLIHLGDLCDSLDPHTAEDTVKILKENSIRGVLGNNEYSMITEHHNEHVQNISADVMNYLKQLPYVMSIGPIWFTHSAPFKWPAATRRPITEYLPHFIEKAAFPFEILFRGHSHQSSIIEIHNKKTKKIPAQAGKRQKLHRNKRYVITVGAVEEESTALFLPEEYEVLFLAIGRT